MEVSLWLLLFPLLSLLVAFTVAPFSLDIATILFVVFALVDALFTTWVMVRLIRLCFAQNPAEEGRIVTNLHLGWELFVPMIWVHILTLFAVLGGSVLLFFPGLWLGVLFAFAPLLVVDSNVRGIKALAASAELVKGRWWPTFWRILAGGFFFLLLIIVSLWALSLFIGLFTGAGAIQSLLNLSVEQTAYTVESFRMETISILLNRLPEALFLPVFYLFLTKLYRILKVTR